MYPNFLPGQELILSIKIRYLYHTIYSFDMTTFSRPLRWQLLFLFSAFLLFPIAQQAQNYDKLLNSYLEAYGAENGFNPADLQDYIISDQYESQHNGLTHIHIRQRYQGIEVYNAMANFAIHQGKVVYMSSFII